MGRLSGSRLKRMGALLILSLLAVLLVVVGLIELSHSSAGPLGSAGSVLLTLALWALIVRTDAQVLLRRLNEARLFLPVLAFVIATFFIGDARGSAAFHEIGAQVIVVLLLALALEARFFRLHRVREPLDLAVTLFTMLILGCGEFYAFQSIASENPAHADMVGGAIAVGFVAVAVAALVGPSGESSKDQA
jgi:hypothetical protein